MPRGPPAGGPLRPVSSGGNLSTLPGAPNADYAFPGGGTAGDGQARRTASCACAGPGAAQADSWLPCVPGRGTGCTVPGSLTTEHQRTCTVGAGEPAIVPS